MTPQGPSWIETSLCTLFGPLNPVLVVSGAPPPSFSALCWNLGANLCTLQESVLRDNPLLKTVTVTSVSLLSRPSNIPYSHSMGLAFLWNLSSFSFAPSKEHVKAFFSPAHGRVFFSGATYYHFLLNVCLCCTYCASVSSWFILLSTSSMWQSKGMNEYVLFIHFVIFPCFIQHCVCVCCCFYKCTDWRIMSENHSTLTWFLFLVTRNSDLLY